MLLNRKNFGSLKAIIESPNLLDIQTESFVSFLQPNVNPKRRKKQGLQAVLHEVFPIETTNGEHKLEFLSYNIDRPKYDIEECKRRGMTYSSALKLRLRLKSQNEIKEQEVYLGDIPIMSPVGTFIVNGDERVVVSQLHRSPGISYEEEVQPNGKRAYSARLIPYRGAWLEFAYDQYDVLQAYVDRKRKVLSTTLLRAIGLSTNIDILQELCGIEKIKCENRASLKSVVGRRLAEDVVDPTNQQLLIRRYEIIDPDHITQILEANVHKISVLVHDCPEIINTLEKDHSQSKEEALLDIFRKLRPGDPATLESASTLLDRLFFDKRRYNLEPVGRYILNRKLKMDVDLKETALDKETILAAIKRLLLLKEGKGETDDIDHLGNRRVRTVGELLQNQFRIGLTRVERSCRERMAIYEIENIMPHNLVNSKLVSSVIRDFFGRSQLSQFMDQTNPLAEMTHKRRLSALGPGGLSRERAGFEVRDVHHSHYGRICPIETPEGPNIGLIASLSTYARINEYGFIETPYRVVKKGKVSNDIDYLSADVEDQNVLAQANARIDNSGKFLDESMICRYRGNFPTVAADDIDYMDVAPTQLVSIAASLIPFLEHDDANRALMGSNMQRQAVPLLFTDSPYVGTGMETKVARDSGAVVVAENSGIVKAVQADEIVVGDRQYKLKKFLRSNASTCINQRPLVNLGDKIKAGDIIADGAATDNGELALGRNVLVAFMPWRGYNFEDAVLISEKLLKEDVYTSVHVEEFIIEARDTRLGNEEITRDIPNVGDEALKNLDVEGVIRLGAEVTPGDILVGKVTPKTETELSPEEKLLRAIFGEKAGDVRDASLTVPPGVEGIIVNVEVFSRKGKAKSREELTIENKKVEELKKYYDDQVEGIVKEKMNKFSKYLLGVKLSNPILDDDEGNVIVPANKKITEIHLKKMESADLDSIKFTQEPEKEDELKRIIKILNDQMDEIRYEQDREIDVIKRGDELPPGVLKKVVVHVASKRKISVGDKVAGRHGNKGVIAKILPEEDLPFLPDGTPVEIVLNPLGVPSRMNVGQILETHLGWAAQLLGFKIATPVFDGASENQILEHLEKAGIPLDGKTILRDGFSGEEFKERVTVGQIYILKLAHLVDDKIHARSIGPYSLVTQQPLGGKAQFGGQRFGEMEVWALEAYGAAYTLQELLTVKSDDVVGRTKIYESIVKGENSLKSGTPESLNVLVKELKSLALDVKDIREDEKTPEE